MKQLTKRGNLLRFILLAILILFFFAAVSFYRYGTIRRQTDLSLRKKLVGTWVGEEGNIVAFRSDATARARIPETKGVQFSEWTTSGNQLKFFLGKGSYVQVFKRYVLGESSQSMEIIEASDDKLVLLDHSSGQRTALKKTNDAILDEAN